MLIARLENLQGHDETDWVKVDLEQTVPLDDWTEGVKDLNNPKEDQLWEKLGLPEKKLPFSRIGLIQIVSLVIGLQMVKNGYTMMSLNSVKRMKPARRNRCPVLNLSLPTLFIHKNSTSSSLMRPILH